MIDRTHADWVELKWLFITGKEIKIQDRVSAVSPLTWSGGPRRQLVLGVLGMLVWLSGMWDGGVLGQDSGSVQSLQSGQAGSWRAQGWTGPLSCSDPSDGRVGLQDESGQGLCQFTFPSSILYIWNDTFSLNFPIGVLLLSILEWQQPY